MKTIRIRKTIDSDTLTIPELNGMIGCTVAIVIEEQPTLTAPDEFWAYTAKLPNTEAEFATQQATLRMWRTDPRFESHWPMIDLLLTRDFERTQKWVTVTKSVQELCEDGYDFNAWRRQRDFDANHAETFSK